MRSKAPLRLSFAGGGTDVPPYSERYGGAVVNATINRYSYASLRSSDGRSAHIESLDLNESIECGTDADLQFNGTLDLAKAVLRRVGRDVGPRHRASLLLHTDAPPGSGLGSSSAAVVAMLGAFKEWLRLPWDPARLARYACEVEREDLRIPGGYQDQYAAVYGGFNFIEFNSKVTVRRLKVPKDVANELNYCLLLCYTGSVEHHSGIIEDQVRGLVSGAAPVKEALDRTKELAYEMRGALLTGDVHEIGEILDEAWQAKKRFAKAITNPTLDRIYAGAKANGALGGKITGAGGGGHMLFLCDPERRRDCVRFLSDHGLPLVDFTFEPAGLQTWRVP